MTNLRIRIPGAAEQLLGPERPELSIGRGSGNDVVLEDPSISRRHARLSWRGGEVLLEDLDSRNGSMINGFRIQGTRRVHPGDEICLGKVSFRLEPEPTTGVVFDEARLTQAGTSLLMPVSKLRDLQRRATDGGEGFPLAAVLALLQDLSLELLKHTDPEAMLSDLLDRLFPLLKPGRGAALLRDAKGELQQVALKAAQHVRHAQIRYSRSMVEAAMERREAMLVNHPLEDSQLGQAQSLMIGGVTTVMCVPLECDGQVAGLIYLDACPPRLCFTEQDLSLVASLGHLVAARIHSARLAEELARRRDMEKELAVARQIQQRLLPVELPGVDGYELFGANMPCHEVSGDLYGFWPREDGRVWFVIADVAGKGVGPGLLMATFQATMAAWAESTDPPEALALRISKALAARTTPNRYITAFLGLLEPATGRVACVNAGHNPVLLRRADGSCGRLESGGFPLAMFPGTPYRAEECQLGPGDLLCLYTDGLTEAADPEGNEFELGGIQTVLDASAGEELPRIERNLHEALERHTQGAPAADDRTLVLLRRQA